MSRILLYCSLTIFALIQIGCDKEIDLEIAYQLTYSGEILDMNQTYDYPDGKKIRFTRFSFFTSDLVASNGDQNIMIKEVDFVNLTDLHQDADQAAAGLVVFSDKVELSGVEQISFNLGLTPSQNEHVPADFATDHPQGKPGEYWLAWNSYIFMKVEGWIDLDGDDNPETSMALHLGSDQVMRHVTVNTDDLGERVLIQIDVAKVFDGSTLYDIGANPKIHHLGQMPFAEELVDNFTQAVRGVAR